MRRRHVICRLAAALFAATIILICGFDSARADTPEPASVDLIVQEFFDTGSDQIVVPGGGDRAIDGAGRIGGDVIVPLNDKATPLNRLRFEYAHGNLLHTEGRVTHAGGLYDYPGSRYDQTDTFSLNETLGSAELDGGYFYKHRVCCPAASDPTNTRPSDEHMAYLGGDVNFGPKPGRESLFNFRLTGWRSLDHQFGPPTAGYKNLGDLYLYSTAITMHGYVDEARRYQPYLQASISNDYYNNRPVPYYFHSVDAGIVSRFSPRFKMTLNLGNVTEFNEGYPYTFPNAIHFTLVTVTADFNFPFHSP